MKKAASMYKKRRKGKPILGRENHLGRAVALARLLHRALFFVPLSKSNTKVARMEERCVSREYARRVKLTGAVGVAKGQGLWKEGSMALLLFAEC